MEAGCQGEWRILVLVVEAALSEKSAYLGSAWVRLSLSQDPGL